MEEGICRSTLEQTNVLGAFRQIQMYLIKYNQDLPAWMEPSGSTVQDNKESSLGQTSEGNEDCPSSTALDLLAVKKEPYSYLEDNTNVDDFMGEGMKDDNVEAANVIKEETGSQKDETFSDTEMSGEEHSKVELSVSSDNPELLSGDISTKVPKKGPNKKTKRSALKLVSEQAIEKKMRKTDPKLSSRRSVPKKLIEKEEGNEGQPLFCHICGFKSTKSFIIANHLFKIHANSNKDLFSCNKCQKAFTSQLIFDQHMEKHRTHKYRCPFCQEIFVDARSLRQHKATKCDRIDAVCNICGFKTNNNTKLRQHLLYVHKQVEKDVFLCETCNLPFSTKKRFDEHQEKHKTGFPCLQCPEIFPDYQALTMHRRKTHLRIYCKYCTAIFTQAIQCKVSVHLI